LVKSDLKKSNRKTAKPQNVKPQKWGACGRAKIPLFDFKDQYLPYRDLYTFAVLRFCGFTFCGLNFIFKNF